MMCKIRINNSVDKVFKYRELIKFMMLAALILLGVYNFIFSVVAFGFAIYLCLTMHLEDSLCMLYFILPMATIFKLAPGQTSLFTLVELFWVIVAFYKKNMKATKQDMIVITYTVFLIVCQCLNGGFNINATIKLIFGLLIVSSLEKIKYKECYSKLFLSYIIGIIVSSLIGCIKFPMFNISLYIGAKTERLVGAEPGDLIERFSGLYGDPNYYSVNLIIAMVLVLILYKNNILKMFSTIILLFVFTGFAAMTGSKSALFMLIIPVTLYIYICIKKKQYVVFSVSLFIIGVAIGMVLTGKIPAFSVAVHRLASGKGDFNLLTTGRGDKWIEFITYMLNRPWMLVFGGSLLNIILNGGAPHNTYIDMLFQLGIVGTIWLILILFTEYRRVRNGRFHMTIINYSVIGVVAVMYFFLSELQYIDFSFHIALGIIVLTLNFDKESPNK